MMSNRISHMLWPFYVSISAMRQSASTSQHQSLISHMLKPPSLTFTHDMHVSFHF